MEKDVEFISIQEQIDTSIPTGVLVFTTFSSLLEFEREIRKERVIAGLAAAKACGKVGGRKEGLWTVAKVKAATAKCLYAE